MRWFWIDRFTEFRSGEYAKSVRNLSMAEDIFRDYYPGYPVMPRSLIVEGMAQTGGILAGEANRFQKMVVLAKLSKVEFHQLAFPGDRITYESELVDLRDEGSSVSAIAHVDGRPIAEAEIVFGHVERPATDRSFELYRQELMRLLGIEPEQPADVAGD